MTISKRVQKELYSAAPAGVLPPLHAVVAAQTTTPAGKRAANKGPKKTKSERALAAAIAQENKGKAWTDEEHARFLEALKAYPSGPWKAIADFVGTKNSRQTMTHAQKYRQKHERRERGLRNRSKQRKAARAKVAASSSSSGRSTAKTRSQTVVKQIHIDDDDDDNSDADEPATPFTPQLTAASPSSDSPRSGEESSIGMGVTYVESMAFDSLMADVSDDSDEEVDSTGADSWEQLKISSISEMFQDFEPMNFMPAMWSTNSLGDIEMLAAVHAGANELFSDSTNPLSL